MSHITLSNGATLVVDLSEPECYYREGGVWHIGEYIIRHIVDYDDDPASSRYGDVAKLLAAYQKLSEFDNFATYLGTLSVEDELYIILEIPNGAHKMSESTIKNVDFNVLFTTLQMVHRECPMFYVAVTNFMVDGKQPVLYNLGFWPHVGIAIDDKWITRSETYLKPNEEIFGQFIEVELAPCAEQKYETADAIVTRIKQVASAFNVRIDL